MGDFPSNSHKKPDTDAPKIERVTVNETITRKTPLAKRLGQTFFSGSAKGAWGYVFYDVLVPAAKDMFSDAVSQGVEKIVYSDTRSTSRRTGARPTSQNGQINYTRYGQSNSQPSEHPALARGRGPSPRARANHDFQEIILATRGEAELVLERMLDILERYNAVKVSDLYDLVGVTSQFTDERWGWTELQGAGIDRITQGYLLSLPQPDSLKP